MRKLHNNVEDFDPIVIEDLNYFSKWIIKIEGVVNEFVYEEDDFTWA
jgi:hypothetical protein